MRGDERNNNWGNSQQQSCRRIRVRHMLKPPSCADTTTAKDNNNNNDNSVSAAACGNNSFCKDGRKISVGDCALFKPPQDCPPFIGLIRSLSAGRENKLKLGVNWLYRPAEVKLSKGSTLEAAPNELFYSFHTDDILAASLLHPCRVAFLPRGVKLPPGVSSFVCRRVYDITNKCLWWLTDQDFINERQQEVDQLLQKTRIEMHGAVQPSGRSPRPINSPTSSQLKAGSDSVQSSGSSIGSQSKGGKRERGEQGSEPVKRERIAKTEDTESGQYTHENGLKSDLTKFTDKGGLVDSEGVEKLVQLMVPDITEKKLDLACRSLLAGVIASTEKFDCLSQFVQLRGLQVFDEWLQEVHKGKIGDSNGAKDADRLVEEFLLVLLRALDKLPVNLQALQKCNIGKSVNHLRSHKNMEIQKKSRSLVDRWKKRVEAEMNINDAKSGPNQGVSWPTRPRPSETSHGGSRHYSGSSEVAVKSLATQVLSSKTAPAKSSQAEAATKSASVSPGSVKSSFSPTSATTNLKDGQSCPSVAGVSSDPPSVARNDKSSISSQSYNNSQLCSGDQARLEGSASKEDARSSTAGSFLASRASGSRHRKSAVGFSGLSGIRKKSGLGRSSLLHRSSDPDKVLHAGLTGEKIVESPVEGNSHKLIVKIPNHGRSPARGSIGGPLDGPSAMNSQASSPVLPEKHDRHDHNSKEKSGTCRANDSSDVKKDSWQGNDYRDKSGDSDVGRSSPFSSPDEERNRTSSEGRKLVDVSKVALQISGSEHESSKLHEDSLSSINVLIESCVKYSESNSSMSVADDIGMNLLASVAAREMSKSELVSPTGSSERNSSPTEKSCTFNDSKAKSEGAGPASEQFRSSDGVSNEHVKLEEHDGYTSSGMYMQQFAEHCIEGGVKSNLSGAAGDSVSVSAGTLDRVAESGSRQSKEENVFNDANTDCNADCKMEARDGVLNEKKATDVAAGVTVEMGDPEGISGPSLEIQNNKNIIQVSSSTLQRVQKPPSGMAKVKSEDALMSSASGKDIGPDSVFEVRAENPDERDTSGDFDQAEKKKIEVETNATIKTEIQVGAACVVTASTNQESDCVLGKVSDTDGLEIQCSRPGPDGLFSAVATQEVEESVRSKCSKLNDTDLDDADECTSTTPDASALPPLTDTKAAFDLNEGLNADDGRCMEQTNVTAAVCTTPVPIISPFPFPASSVSLGLPASITVAAPAKGPFVPPEDLLRNRGELGWKGSAATSAFRPAEPRRVLEMSSVTNNSAVGQEVSSKKTSRAPLDIDLNVPDDRILEDIFLSSKPQEMGSASVSTKCYNGALLRSSGGLGLDLNELVEANDMGECAESNKLRLLDAQLLPGKASPVSLSNGEINSYRDFDLNNGPAIEEATAEPVRLSQHTRSNLPAHAPVSGFQMNNTNIGNFSSWFPLGNSYSAITIPSALSDRGEQTLPVVASGGPPRMIATGAGGALFNTDMYTGPVLSSSPAAPFGSSPFQYPVFPFGTSFPVPSATFSSGSSTYVDSSTGGRLCFSPVPSQLLGPTAAVSSPFPRPYVVSLTDGSINSGAECSRNWGRQGLDLNAGPGGHDIEGRYESSSPFSSRQQSHPSSHAVGEEQARIYHVPGATPKRKAPDGGWNGYRQFSWQ